jgi:hypothetical protein
LLLRKTPIFSAKVVKKRKNNDHNIDPWSASTLWISPSRDNSCRCRRPKSPPRSRSLASAPCTTYVKSILINRFGRNLENLEKVTQKIIAYIFLLLNAIALPSIVPITVTVILSNAKNKFFITYIDLIRYCKIKKLPESFSAELELD